MTLHFVELVLAHRLLPSLCGTGTVPVLAQDHRFRTVQIKTNFGQVFVSRLNNSEITTTSLKQKQLRGTASSEPQRRNQS